jgi:hypothetical protein
VLEHGINGDQHLAQAKLAQQDLHRRDLVRDDTKKQQRAAEAALSVA